MLTVCKDNHYLKNGLRRPKADKGVLEGLPPPRIMSRQANGGGRSEGLRPGAAGYIRGSAPKKHLLIETKRATALRWLLKWR